jgi:hypothetical protein
MGEAPVSDPEQWASELAQTGNVTCGDSSQAERFVADSPLASPAPGECVPDTPGVTAGDSGRTGPIARSTNNQVRFGRRIW